MTGRRWFGGRRDGFTLVELVLVLVLVGVIVGVALPNINIARIQVDGAMRGVGSLIVASQRLAVTRQHDVILSFDQAKQAIRIHEDANNDGVTGANERVRSLPLGDKIAYGRGPAPARSMGPGPVTFTQTSGGIPAVTFHRNGSASQAGGIYLTSRRALNTNTRPEDARAIEIDRATGRVSWYRYGTSWVRGF